MIEKKVKEVFLIYLKNKGEYSRPRSIHSRGADILIKGKAYEIKGSDFDKTRAIKQLISYAFDYQRVNLVLPYDALNFTFLYQLEAIEKFLSHPTSCSIGAYLVTEKTDRIYAIYRFSSLNILNSKVNTLLYQMSKKTFTSLSGKEKEKKIQDYVLSLEKKIKEEFRNLVINEGEIIVLKANDI
ncbi:hypothetical protein ES703_82573 [subsurface metagenome]